MHIYIILFILLYFIIKMLYYVATLFIFPSESLDRILFFNIINLNVYIY